LQYAKRQQTGRRLYAHFDVFKSTVNENFVPEPLDVKFASTGTVIHFPANKSALEILLSRGLDLSSSRELGVCGTCECRYLEGLVIHLFSLAFANNASTAFGATEQNTGRL
jgi:ferredoxin